MLGFKLIVFVYCPDVTFTICVDAGVQIELKFTCMCRHLIM